MTDDLGGNYHPPHAILNISYPVETDRPQFSKSKKIGRREYLRARVKHGKVEIFHSEGSGRISSLSWADGLVELHEDISEIKHGDLVKYMPFSGII